MGGTRRYRDQIRAEPGERTSLGRLLTQEFRHTEEDQEESAARERNRALNHAPVFFLAVHIVCVAAIVLDLRPNLPLAAPIPLGLMLAVDLAAWLWFRKKPISSLAPHIATRGAAGYAVLANVLWGAAAIAAAPVAAQDPALLDIALVGGVLAVTVAFLTFPSLTLLRCLGLVAKTLVLARNPAGAAAAALLSLCLVRLSLKRAADRAGELRRRIEVGWAAQRASRFIEEFEQSGRGWFWGTTGRGRLSSVSQQLA